MDSGYLTQSRN